MSDRLGRLLMHSLRHRLLFEYAREPAHPSEVARRLGQPLNLVAYHTGVLLRHGLLELVRIERHRGGLAHYYRSPVSRIIEDDGWDALAPQLRRALVRGLLAVVSDETHKAALAGAFDATHVHISRWPVRFDEVAIAEADRLLRTVMDDLAAIQAQVDRRADPALAGYHVVLMGFSPGSPRGR